MTRIASLSPPNSAKSSPRASSSPGAWTDVCSPTVVRIGIDSSSLELDKQGRVMIPSALSEHAKLGREVVVAGVNDHLEIWDRAAWRAELAEFEGSAEDVAERLATKHD